MILVNNVYISHLLVYSQFCILSVYLTLNAVPDGVLMVTRQIQEPWMDCARYISSILVALIQPWFHC